MSITPQIDKLSPSILVYSYDPEEDGMPQGDSQSVKQKGKLYLIVAKHWVQSHQDMVRKFFMAYYQAPPESSLLESLQLAADTWGEEQFNAIGLVLHPPAVYALCRGEMELWLIRDSQTAKLISGLENQAPISGWLKNSDVFVPLMGIFSQAGVERRLQNVARQLGKSPNEPRAITSVFRSSGFTYPAAVISWTPHAKKVVPKSVLMDTQEATPVADQTLDRKQMIPSINLDYQRRKWQSLAHDRWTRLLAYPSLVTDKLIEILQRLLPTEAAIYAIEQQAVKDKMRSRNRKILLGTATILLIGLSISIGWGVKQRRQAEWQTKFGEIIADLQFKLQESRNLAELNPQRAQDLVQQAKGQIDVLQQRGLEEDQLNSLQQQVGEVLGLALGQREAQSKLWMNLGLVREGMRAEDMQVYEDQVVVLDENQDRVVLIGLNDKSSKVMAGQEQVGLAKQVAIYNNKVYVYGDQGLTELQDDEAKVIFPADPEWGRVFDLQIYAGNIYLATDSGIWKYPVIESGFGDKQAWLADEAPSLAGGSAMTIDGFVWVAFPNKILKFARGVEDNFQITNLEQGFTEIRAIYAGEDTDYLYVLEPNAKRIVLLDKDTGVYHEQYMDEAFGQASDLVANEKEQLMLVLTKDKILEVSLQ